MQTIHWTNIFTLIIMTLYFLSRIIGGLITIMEQKKKMGFSSRWGFVLAAVGSAVGMANVWGFLVACYGGKGGKLGSTVSSAHVWVP